jgi:hypothetical protein
MAPSLRVIAANQAPDHAPIGRFPQRHKDAIADLLRVRRLMPQTVR